MKFKKLVISFSILACAATPLACLLAISSNPRAPKPSSTYLMNFATSSNSNNTNSFDIISSNGNFGMGSNSEKQAYLNNLIKQVEEVFVQYKQKHPDYKGLQLDYINLKTSPTPGEVSFFTELDKTFKAINPNLSFNMIQRSPSSVQQGFYQKNADMISQYWSPDYNDVGTWLSYMFGDYQTPNMWPAVSSAINKTIRVINEKDNVEQKSWVDDLLDFIKKRNFGFKDENQNFVPLVNEDNKAITMDKVMEYIDKGSSSSEIYATMSNAVAAWADSSQAKKYGGTLMNLDDPNVMKNGMFKDYQGGIENFKPAMQTNFLDFINSYNPNMPYEQDGPNTRANKLVRLGAHVPDNTNAYLNYRDWFYEDGVYKKDGVFNDWSEVNPFATNVTALNPTFNKVTNALSFNSIYTPLFSWSTIGDFYTDSNYKDNYRVVLTANGTSANPKELAEAIDNGFTSNDDVVDNFTVGHDENGNYVDLPIRPIPWVNYKGETTKNIEYLSPQDYWAGFKGYKRSVDVKMNANGYFIDMIGLNIKATLDYKGNQERNLSPNDHKSFRLYFDNPALTGSNIVDILSNSLFSALPAFSPLVQNITDDNKFEKIAKTAETNGVLNTSNVDMSQFYGSGYGPNKAVWSQLWSTGPYYISEINDQRIVFNLNKQYFGESIDNPGVWADVKNDPNYIQYFLNATMDLQPKANSGLLEDKKVKIKRFETIKTTYSSAYNDQLAFEQFKTGELDRSKIPSANLPGVFNDPALKKQVYEPLTLKINKSNLIPYNLQVYELDKRGSILLFDDKGKKVPFDSNNVAIDQYGNYIFKNGVHPKIKTKISDGYYDLIVKNFFTPIDAKDKNGNLLPAIDRSSAIIRTAINDCINWYAIISIIQNGKTQVIQNSFTPYGVINLGEVNDSRLTYWSLSTYKVSTAMDPNLREIGNRIGGLVEWTWPEYMQVWQQQLKGDE